MSTLVTGASNGLGRLAALRAAAAGKAVAGLVRSVVRDTAQSEEVTQEVLVEVWRGATQYHAEKGSA